MQTTSPSPGLFFETINAYQRTEALRAAIEIDLFSALTAGSKTAEEISQVCKASSRGVRILADYLTIVGFLKKSDERYELTPDSAVFLDRKSPAYLGGTLQFLLAPSLVDCFSQLTAAVRKGGTAVSDDGTVSHDNPIWVDFARGMAPLMHLPAQLLVGLIGGDRTQPLRVLDVAAGHGMFGIAVAQQYPNAQITALDWQNVLAVAAENAAKAGVKGRHHLRPGSAFDTDWGGPYDIVLLTNFFHHFDLPTCEQIAQRAYASLVPGGRAITLEFIPDQDRISPPGAATFALTMLASTGHGDAYTFPEYQILLTKAGFARNEFHPLPPTMQQAIVSYR
ncbi:MAG: crtF [Schlesneria sp.]|nr:crtF [Schlesneria sp.]